MKDLREALSKQVAPKPQIVEPIPLFRSLRIKTGSSIKEIWAPQAEALQAWHAVRSNSDVLLQLKTGAGKTLIGLIVAQSLVNETKSRVLYCCATKQLVEQTREKAEEVGISTATYMAGEWNSAEVDQKAVGPLITTYAALFNGKSIFARRELSAIIFDDAHTAHDSIRDAFTLSIHREAHLEIYSGITGAVADYFSGVNRSYVFDTIVKQRDPSSVLMVPLFESYRRATQVTQLLLQHGVEDSTDLMFAWNHLSQHLDRCIVLFDSQKVQITPLLPAVHKLNAFQRDVRRVYLSATLRVNDQFIRTFGRMPSPVISPEGRAGDGQRLFLVPASQDSDQAARESAEAATRGIKAVIMVPSGRAAAAWQGKAEVFGSDGGHARIKAFTNSMDERLVFIARYDGIDLPDDACRVMIVDGLPTGMSLLDRFFEQQLELGGVSDGKIASRFVQLLGRTSRGMSDYGAVFLIGRRLLDWVFLPAHRAILPEHIQRQIAVGERLSALEDFTPRELLELCLKQVEEWTTSYEEQMDATPAEPEPTIRDRESGEQLARAERAASEAIWDGMPEKAAQILSEVRSEAFKRERSLGAWLLHWQAFATQLAGDDNLATQLYAEAARAKRDVGTLPVTSASSSAVEESASSAQAKRMSSLLHTRGWSTVESELEVTRTALSEQAVSAAVHEEAIRRLGEYLGYEASRPEKETGGKGPDDLWVVPGEQHILLFDAKTKKINKSYEKNLIGRSAQHALWAAEAYPHAERLHFLVGPRVPATPQSTPPAGLRIVAAAELSRVAADVAAVYRRAHSRGLPLFYAAEIQIGLEEAALNWEALPSSWDSVRLDSL